MLVTPLEGLRVLELASGVAGPYAGRLLAMLGAEVVKIEPEGGDPARTCPLDDEPLAGISPLYVHLNAGKRNVSRTRRDDALDRAEVIIDSRVRGDIDPALLDPSRRRILASVTAWGFEAGDPGSIHDELLVQARSGVMTVTGDPGREPLRFPGWQSQYMAGAYTAASILGCLRTRAWSHIDIAWVTAIASGTEAGFQRHLSTGDDLPPAGAHPVRVFPSGAIACSDGHVVPGTVRRADWELQCGVYGMPELMSDDRFGRAADRSRNLGALAEAIQPWYDRHSKREIFSRALEAGWACGMVVTALDALTDEHMRARGFAASGVPVSLVRGDGLPVSDTRVSEPGEDDAWLAGLEP
jgi:crotonobetainyl-CoA:carnitine CoA-transferase CaiB-like acyl-CoA transferase